MQQLSKLTLKQSVPWSIALLGWFVFEPSHFSSVLQAAEWTLSRSRPSGRHQGNKWPPAPRGETRKGAVCFVRSTSELFHSLLLSLLVAAQIWDRQGLRKCLNLSAVNKHGRVYDDGEFVSMRTLLHHYNRGIMQYSVRQFGDVSWHCCVICVCVFPAQFGCLSWSQCENKLLYVAEKLKSTWMVTHDGEHAFRKVLHRWVCSL